MKIKITAKLIEDVIAEVAGADVIPLYHALKDKKNVSEFKIAEQLDIEVNLIRNMLYRLYDANLVTFIRKKDKIKGWYIYYWTFNPKRIKYLLTSLKKQKLEKLRDRLKREHEEHFFVCQSKCIRLDFEQATDFEYKCPECGNILCQEDNTEKIAEIEKQIKELEASVNS